MCRYTLKKQKLKKKLNSSRGVGNSTKCPKIRRLRRKEYLNNKQRFRDGMLHTGRI